jgi:hypothetical protein
MAQEAQSSVGEGYNVVTPPVRDNANCPMDVCAIDGSSGLTVSIKDIAADGASCADDNRFGANGSQEGL